MHMQWMCYYHIYTVYILVIDKQFQDSIIHREDVVNLKIYDCVWVESIVYTYVDDIYFL